MGTRGGKITFIPNFGRSRPPERRKAACRAVFPMINSRNDNSALANCTGALLLGDMLGWSMNLFRIGRIQLAVHFSFFLLLAVHAFDGWVDSGWAGLWWKTATLLTFFTCVVLHELGH